MSWIYCPVSGKLPSHRVYHAAAPLLSTKPLSSTYTPQDESRILLFGGATVLTPNPTLNNPSSPPPASLSTISRASLDISQLSSHTNSIAAVQVQPSPPSSSPELSHHITDATTHSEDPEDSLAVQHSHSASVYSPTSTLSHANDNS